MKTTLLFLFLILLTVMISPATQAQTYHFQEGFATNAQPAGWLATNVLWSANHNNGLYAGDYSAKLKPNESFLMTKAVNTADVLAFFVKVRDTMAADDFHLIVEKSYDKNTWTEIARDPCNMKNDSVFQSVTLSVNDPASEIYLRFHAISVNGTAALGLCYLDDISVTKRALSPSDATLMDFSFNGTSLPDFTATNLDYQAEVPYYIEQATVAGVPNNPAATLAVTQPANLLGNELERTGSVKVTSPDGTATKTYKIVFTVSKYIYKIGFEKTGDGVMPLPGWMGGYTYTSSTIPMGNHGDFPGPAAMKFMRGQPDKIGFLITAKYVKSDTLSFWLAVDQADGVEKLSIEKRVLGGVKVPIALLTSADMTANWQHFQYSIKENDSTEIIFTPTLTSEGLTRIWIDDLSMTGKPRNVGMEEEKPSHSVVLLPNPVADRLNVQLNGSRLLGIEIFDITGRKVIAIGAVGNSASVGVDLLAPGAYIARIRCEGETFVRKFVKQ